MRWIDLTVPLTRTGHLKAASELALIQASETLAAGCFRSGVAGLKAQIAQAMGKAAHQRIVELAFGRT